MKKRIIFIYMILSITILAFDIDIGDIEGLDLNTESDIKKEEDILFNTSKLNVSGKFENSIKQSWINSESGVYILKNRTDESQHIYSGNLNLDLNYKLEKHELLINTYTKIESDNSEIAIYEAYINYMPNYNFFMQTGKVVLNWGKGYVYNPIGIMNPKKDPDSPDDTKEGINLINLEYTKSLDNKFFTTFGSNLVFDISSSGEENDNIDFVLKNYFLIGNSDLDLLYGVKDNKNQFGFDIATNLLSELEFHGEILYEENSSLVKFDSGGELDEYIRDTLSYILGLKYVLPTNTNLTLEYFHNDKNSNESSYKNIMNSSLNDSGKLEFVSTYFNEKNFMRDYLYLKLSHNEPFGIYYTSIGYTNIFNIYDSSFSNKAYFTYAPYSNISYNFEIASLNGGSSSEFGDKENVNLLLGVEIYF